MKKGIIGCIVFCLSVGLLAGGAVTITATGDESTPYKFGSTNIKFKAVYDSGGGEPVDSSTTKLEAASGYTWTVTGGTFTGTGDSIAITAVGTTAGSFTVEAKVTIDYEVKDKDGDWVACSDSPFTRSKSIDFDVVEVESITYATGQPANIWKGSEAKWTVVTKPAGKESIVTVTGGTLTGGTLTATPSASSASPTAKWLAVTAKCGTQTALTPTDGPVVWEMISAELNPSKICQKKGSNIDYVTSPKNSPLIPTFTGNNHTSTGSISSDPTLSLGSHTYTITGGDFNQSLTLQVIGKSQDEEYCEPQMAGKTVNKTKNDYRIFSVTMPNGEIHIWHRYLTGTVSGTGKFNDVGETGYGPCGGNTATTKTVGVNHSSTAGFSKYGLSVTYGISWNATTAITIGRSGITDRKINVIGYEQNFTAPFKYHYTHIKKTFLKGVKISEIVLQDVTGSSPVSGGLTANSRLCQVCCD